MELIREIRGNSGLYKKNWALDLNVVSWNNMQHLNK